MLFRFYMQYILIESFFVFWGGGFMYLSEVLIFKLYVILAYNMYLRLFLILSYFWWITSLLFIKTCYTSLQYFNVGNDGGTWFKIYFENR